MIQPLIKIITCLFFITTATSLYSAEITPFNGHIETVKSQGYQLLVNGNGHHQSFEISELEKLPLYTSNFTTPWGLDGDFVGIRLIDLLEKVGISDFKRLLVRASNDYKVTIEHSDEGLETALVATRLNGQRFTLSDKGPYFIIWPAMNEKLLAGDVDPTKWAWSVVEIRKVR